MTDQQIPSEWNCGRCGDAPPGRLSSLAKMRHFPQ